MGIPLKDVVIAHEISYEDLKGKKLAFDTNNILYQFISAIRQRDGTPLKDSHGNVTSHLVGIFTRTAKLIEHGIKPCFVFDGKPLALKARTTAKRQDIRSMAAEKHKTALAEGRTEDAKKYAQQASRLTLEMVAETKELLDAMGLPHVQALSDGEAQAAYMAKKGLVWGVASQDYDGVLFGSPRLIRNLTVSRRKKIPGKVGTVQVNPHMITLTEVLNHHQIDIQSLVRAALLVGTDFNPGIKGIGPKTALKIVKEGKFEDYAGDMPVRKQLEDIFLNPAVTTGFSLKWKAPDVEKIKEILIGRHDFAENRVETSIKKLVDAHKKSQQKGLGDF